MGQAMYEVRVEGAVPQQDLQDMGAVAISPGQVSTVLYGVPDQAALYGLLARLQALGIEVVEVRRLPSVAGQPDDEAGPPVDLAAPLPEADVEER